MQKYCLHIPADLEISPALRTIAVRIFEECGFAGTALAHLKLVFDEILMNAVKYGSRPGSSIWVGFEFDTEKLTVSFEDEGGTRHVSASELQEIVDYQKQNNDPGKTSGRGLAQIASNWSDELLILDGKRGGLCIVFAKFLHTPEKLPQPGTAPTKQENADVQKLSRQIFVLEGEIDNLNFAEKVKPVDAFVASLQKPLALILDLQKLQFCNSTFIARLAFWKQEMEKANGALVLQNTPAPIREILELVGLTNILTILSGEFGTAEQK